MNFPAKPLDILVVATHPDDAEISVGGIIRKSCLQGKRVGVIDLTNGEPTPHGTLSLRQQETAEASDILGLHWRGQLGLPNRKLEPTLAARRALAEIFRLTRPRLLLAPYWEDSHPDHVAASALTDAARFWAKLSRTDLRGEPFLPPQLFYYWSIHLRIHPQPACVFDISEVIEDKLQAVACYASQRLTTVGPAGVSPLDDIRDRARYWGWSIHKAYGEPLACREELRIDDFDVLSG